MAFWYFILIVALCLINIFSIYSITSAFESLRQPIQIVLIIASLFQMVNGSKRISYLKQGPIICITLLFIYLTFQLLFNSNNLINDFSNSLFGLIILYLFYTAKYDINSLKRISDYSFPILLVFSILYLYRRIDPAFQSPEMWSLYSNSIYYPICLLPFTLLNKYFALPSIICVLLCTFISSKQGAFIAIIISGLVYYFINQRMTGKNVGIKFLIIISILSIIGILAYNYAVTNYNIDIMQGFSTMQEDGGSGRLDIYTKVLSKLDNSDLFQLLFGHGGLNSVASDVGISAHNDFLEVVYDFGIIGFILYISLIGIIIKGCIIAYKRRKNYSAGLISSVIIFLILSSVSHIMFILKYGLYIFSYWGICLSLLYGRRSEK